MLFSLILSTLFCLNVFLLFHKEVAVMEYVQVIWEIINPENATILPFIMIVVHFQEVVSFKIFNPLPTSLKHVDLPVNKTLASFPSTPIILFMSLKLS